MKCSECRYYGKKKMCDLGTDEAVREVVAKNNELLYEISTASKPRFEDTENVERKFRDAVNKFFDVMSVLYTIPMNGYFWEKGASKEKDEYRQYYHWYRNFGYERCIQQVQMRILTLGRASCGFVGEFSSGKSSYLNAEVFGEHWLPVGAGATTSIPTYIFSGRADRIVLENMRGNIRVLPGFDTLKQLAHSAKPKGCPCRFQWDAVIKRLFCFSSRLKYNNDLVYVDLPGYSASADDNRSMKEAIDGCDKIVYFKPVSSGQLNDTDLRYLEAVKDKEVMVVLSKADEKSPAECMKVLKLVKSTLKEKDINVENVILYTNCSDVFAANSDFCKRLSGFRDELNKFILDTSAREKDMALSRVVMEHYLNEFMEHEKGIFSRLDAMEGAFDNFIGKRELDEPFFSTWKTINKNIADSSGKYVEEHFFSENTVRVNEYINANTSRIHNYYMSDIYNSCFNFSYQEAMRECAYAYLYLSALNAKMTGRASDYTTEADRDINNLERTYKMAKGYIDIIFNGIKAFFSEHKELSSSIVGDAQLAFKIVEDAYSELLKHMRNYEKRWFES